MQSLRKCAFIAVLLAFSMLINISASALGIQICYDGATHTYTGEIYKLFVNGEEIVSPMEPIVFNDHALVPVREVFEACGANVTYNEDARSVKIKYNNTNITMHINNNRAYVNGSPVKIPDGVVPKLIYKPGGLTKTMVPVRFISESAGMEVDFDSESGEIHINEKETASTVPTVTEPPLSTVPPTTVPTAKPTEGPLKVREITSTKVSDTVYKIVAECSSSVVGKISAFTLTGPERVVVDFKGAAYDKGDTTTKLDSNVIKSLRTGVDSERTRLVVDVEGLKDYSVDTDAKTVTITVTVTGKTAATPTPAPTVTPTAKPTATPTAKPTQKPSSSTTYSKGFTQASAADAKKIIMIDPGHGGGDPGALGTLDGKTINEKDLTLSISKKVQSILESYGYKTAMTRTGDTFPTLGERPAMANEMGCALFVSIHINSATATSAKGTEVYYSEENNGTSYGITSQKFADNVLETMLKHMNPTNRGVRMANWAVTRRSKMPAILVEVGFISNDSELRLMCSDDYQTKTAKGIAEGIINTVHYVNVP